MAEEATTEEQQDEKPVRPTQNGVTRPAPGTKTGRVWEIADELSAEKGEPAGRAEVLAAYEAEGGNSATGATQYGRWKKFHGLTRANSSGSDTEDEAEVETE